MSITSGVPDVHHLAKMLLASASNVDYLTLSNPAFFKSEYRERHVKPKIGDMVAELTAYFAPAIKRVGELLSITEEPYPDWDEELNGPASTRPVYTIRGLDGQEQRWENCHFVTVPVKSYNESI